MSDGFKAFWLGLFVIGAIVLVSWLVLFLEPSIGDGKVTLKVLFSNIDKVIEGTHVTYGGKPVGEVVKIVEIPNPRDAEADQFGNLYLYELTLKVDSSVQVYTYDEILFSTSGLLGEKSVAILPKAPPFGAPPAENVSNQTLYARSTDQLASTLNQLSNLAERFQDTLGNVNTFINANKAELHSTLTSFGHASEELKNFLERANEMDVAGKASLASDSLIAAMTKADNFFKVARDSRLIERVGTSFDRLHDLTLQFSNETGSIGRLLNSDSTFVQITTVLCQLQSILYDIKKYGILYQFDRKWQRSQSCCTEIYCPG